MGVSDVDENMHESSKDVSTQTNKVDIAIPSSLVETKKTSNEPIPEAVV